MTLRKIVSISIAFCFIVLFITGVLSYLKDYSRVVATLHTAFGFLFTIGVLFHLRNNFRSLKAYSKGKLLSIIVLIGSTFFIGAYFQTIPFRNMMDFGAKRKANIKKELDQSRYEIIELNTHNEIKLTIDLLRSEHYWHPQMAIWTEDAQGNYLETIFVTKATAKGLFFGGRSKENFKNLDENKDIGGDYRRVNALPVWSHKRNVQYEDGMVVPTTTNPLPDGISGATIIDSFNLKTSTKYHSKFHLKIEINVAFDDNEYFSEFDFPDDEIYQNGTGQLGQPSIVFDALVDMNDSKNYYLMDLIGHGHHSGQTGEIYKDLSSLTTALAIVERIVVGVR